MNERIPGTNRTATFIAVIVSTLASGIVPAAADPAQYALTELVAPDGMNLPRPLGMNDTGVVVGEAVDDGVAGYMAAVAWFDGVPVRLTGRAISGAQAAAVNDQGTIVGSTDEMIVVNAFSWTDGELTILPGTHGHAHAIDSAGNIVGSVVDGGYSRAVTWDADQAVQLLPPEVLSEALGRNETGVVVGRYHASEWRAFRWQDGQWQGLPGLAENLGAVANAINASGLIAGWARPAAGSSTRAAVIWQGGTISVLDAPGSTTSHANDLNDVGVVVGRAGGAGDWRAVLWQDGQMHDLRDLVDLPDGWSLDEAQAINNSGHIAGVGSQHGEQRAFLLTPIVPTGIDDGVAGWPAQVRAELVGIHPNPFNPATEITFRLVGDAEVLLEVFDLTGRRVATLVARRLPAGLHRVPFAPRDLATGVYVCRLSVDGAVTVGKMSLLK